ncbi:MAG: phosphotransferase [Arenicella sp.]|nr:phosphotransferase [Arenicella sp.]
MLNQALTKWSDWGLAEKPTLVRVLEDGQNHHTGLIQAGDKKLVLKVFKHSFNRTIEAEYWASELLISPRLYMAANNTALYEFIDDQGYNPKRLKDLADTLSLAHQGDQKRFSEFDLIGFCDSYLVTAEAEIHQWHAALMPALLEFTQDQTPSTYCHNDLVVENCLFTNNSVLLIDWEFAQTNNPWFDLGAIIYYFNLTKSQTKKFLASYQHGWESKVDRRILYTSQVAVLWCDLLWSMHVMGNEYQNKHADRFEQLRGLALKLDITLPT